ncbi:MAG: superoxide dismutase [bacterium]|nr:superoxide dismutase [bacterium]
MKYELPKLAYAYDALEPHIDELTMHVHHDKHHQTYLDKLNIAISGHSDFDGVEIETVLRNIKSVDEKIQQAVINNGGGHSNHSIYWTNLSPNGGGEPTGEIKKAIKSEFNNFEDFKAKFTETAMNAFGSGWTWLVIKDDKLTILSRLNQDSPLLDGYEPLLSLDLWEHAYYLKYQNRRAEYVGNWWNLINWENVNSRLKNK